MVTPTIKVSEPCKCVGKRWFECDCGAYVVAEYECQRPVDGSGPSRVTEQEAAHVQALHPGCTLIYLGYQG